MPKYIVPPGNPLNTTSVPIEIETEGPRPDEDLGKSILGLDLEKLAKNPPPEYKRLHKEYLDAVVRGRLKNWLETKNPESVAIALLAANKDWSVNDIAEKMGYDRKSLYRWPTFKATFQRLKALKKAERHKRTPRGKKFATEEVTPSSMQLTRSLTRTTPKTSTEAHVAVVMRHRRKIFFL